MTIPVSRIVNVVSNVLGATGNEPVLSGLFLTTNEIAPNSDVLSFQTADAVGAYFGLGSTEYDLANRIYFRGYDTGFLTPGAMLIAKYNDVASSAFLQSAPLNITLAQLQDLSGSFTVTVDGVAKDTGALDFSASTSFSEVATAIQTALNTGGAVVTVTWNPDNKTFLIQNDTTGATSTSTFAVDGAGSTLAASLLLTADTGAVLSQGAAADTPATALNRILQITTAWFTLVTLFEPIKADKVLFSSAINDLDKYCYVCWDTEADAIAPNSETCASFLIREANYAGTLLISGDSADAVKEGTTLAKVCLDTATFVSGFVASVDFNQANGRTVNAFRRLSGLLPTVTNPVSATNLINNGYNYYGAYANATNNWVFFYDGSITGKYRWLDSFYGAIYLAEEMQTQEMELLLNESLIPYNPEGFATIRASLTQVIENAKTFGTIQAGVVLDQNQKNIVNNQANLKIDGVLRTNGWYLQILPPSAADRQQRKSPIINLWYTDGQSVQKITIDATDIL